MAHILVIGNIAEFFRFHLVEIEIFGKISGEVSAYFGKELKIRLEFAD